MIKPIGILFSFVRTKLSLNSKLLIFNVFLIFFLILTITLSYTLYQKNQLLINLLASYTNSPKIDLTGTSNRNITPPYESRDYYSYIKTTYAQRLPTDVKYQDQTITFSFPPEWKVYGDKQFGAPYIINIDLLGICAKRIITFSYKYTDSSEPNSYELAQKNPHGPTRQTSEMVVINGIKMGLNNQVVGDGSGGYEPKVVVDFLSKSKRFHYYFIAVRGCRDSHEETYENDLIPILKGVILNE